VGASGAVAGRPRGTAAAPRAGLEAGVSGLVELVDLGDIEGFFQHPPAGGDQQQVVIDQGGGQGHGLLADQGAAAADQPHAAVAAHLQIGAGQAAGLPEALQEAPGTAGIAAAQGQQPVAPGLRARAGGAGLAGSGPVEEGDADLRGEPAGQLIAVVEAGGGEGPIPQALDRIHRLAALPGRGHGAGVADRFAAIAEQVQGDRRIAGDEPGRAGQHQGAMLQLQRAPLPHLPPGQPCQAQQQQQQRQQARQEGPGLHSGSAGWVHPAARPDPCPPWLKTPLLPPSTPRP
jgi:hypothetical protein